MKFILLFMLCLGLIACSADEKAVNSTNQKPVNVNKNVPNINQNPTVTNNNPANNAAKNTANSSGKTFNLGEKFTLKGGETAKIKDTGLEIKVVTAGSAATVLDRNSKQTAAPISYCRVEAMLGGKSDGRQLYAQSGRNEFEFEGFKIQVQNITPTGIIDCSLVVTKIGK